jgi:hypothetical protein
MRATVVSQAEIGSAIDAYSVRTLTTRVLTGT